MAKHYRLFSIAFLQLVKIIGHGMFVIGRYGIQVSNTKRGRLSIVVAALFAFIFLIPSGRITKNHFIVMHDVLLQKQSQKIIASKKITLPPPLLANLVVLDAEYSLASVPQISESDEEGVGFYLDTLPSIQGVAFIESISPLTQELVERTDTYTYIVERGDTPIAIADLFGISLNTLLWANGLTFRSIIRPGDTFTILPVSGISHTVVKNDTVSSLAKKYSASVNDIIAYNNLSDDASLTVGNVLVIPGGIKRVPRRVVVRKTTVSRKSINAPSGWLVQPTPGRNPRWGSGLHGFNGIDITNSCGTPIVAAAEGTVIIADDFGWNGGYGKYIKIQHPNGVVTLYSHVRELLVGAGVHIGQGEGIALMGTTGRSTGCHLHFEVRGARNPFVYLR